MKFTRARARRAAALAGAALTAGLVALPLAAPASAAAESGTVTVIHGVPGLTVDVYVNGKATLTSFAPDTVTPPIALPAGTYTIDIRTAGAPPSAPPAITGTATLAAGANASLVAHLSASGQPELTAYPNTTSGLAAGKARVIVRHDAAAPAVDVRANGQPVITNLTNPNQKSVDVAAGTVSADVVLAGQTTSVIGPATLTLPAGTTTAVYAVGSAQQGTSAPADPDRDRRAERRRGRHRRAGGGRQRPEHGRHRSGGGRRRRGRRRRLAAGSAQHVTRLVDGRAASAARPCRVRRRSQGRAAAAVLLTGLALTCGGGVMLASGTSAPAAAASVGSVPPAAPDVPGPGRSATPTPTPIAADRHPDPGARGPGRRGAGPGPRRCPRRPGRPAGHRMVVGRAQTGRRRRHRRPGRSRGHRRAWARSVRRAPSRRAGYPHRGGGRTSDRALRRRRPRPVPEVHAAARRARLLRQTPAGPADLRRRLRRADPALHRQHRRNRPAGGLTGCQERTP